MSDYSSVRAVLVDLDGNIKIRSTVASLPQGAIDTTVKNNNLTKKTFGTYTGVYQGAYWLSGVMNGPGTPTQELFDGKRLPLKSLTKNDDGSTVVTPTDDVVTPGQGEVTLSALSSEVNQHAVLVYLDTRFAKLVRFTFGGSLTDKSTSAFSTLVYDSATDNARFAVIDENAPIKRYKTTAYVKVPRGQQVRFTAKNSDGTTQTVTPTLISDDSTTDYTVQTYTLEINELVDEINVTTSPIVAKNVKVVARMENEPIELYSQPQFNISYIDPGTAAGKSAGQSWPKCAYVENAWPAPNQDQRYQNCLPNYQAGVKAIDFGEYNIDPWGTGSGVPSGGRLPRHWGFQMDSAKGTYKKPDTHSGSGTDVSEATYTMTSYDRAVYTVEAVPRLWENGWDPKRYCSNGQCRRDYRQDFLSSITLTNSDQAKSVQSNEQTIFVPFPDLCRDPYGHLPTGTQGSDPARYCYIGDSFQGGWTGENGEKNKYSCIRAWMLGYERTNLDLRYGCNSSYDYSKHETVNGGAPHFDGQPPRVMLDYTITQGANAGTRIVVKLLNARNNYDVGVSILDTSRVSEGSGAFPASLNSSRWRTRYQIEVYNLKNPNMVVTANWGWSDQQRVLLGASSGVEPISASKDATEATAVSVYGIGNASLSDIDGQLDWKTICVNGENRGVDGGANGGAGCRYVWQDQHAGTPRGFMPVGFHVKNGYTQPKVQYPSSRFVATLNNGQSSFQTYEPTAVNPVSGTKDSNAYVKLPVLSSTTIDFSDEGEQRRFYMKTRVPIFANAPSVTIPLTYYDDQGTHLDTYTTDAGAKPFADTTVNVVTDPFRNVAGVAPALTSTDADGKPQIFTHWVLKAYKNGQELGTVGNKSADGSVKNYNVVSPRDLLHLSNPVFTTATSSAVSVGGPVITDGTGTAVADELRLVAVPITASSDTTGLTRKHEYYPVRHVVKDTAGTHVVRAFDYTAVPGLDARITDAHIKAWPTATYNSKDYPYDVAGSTTAIGDPTKAWSSTTNAGLVSPSTSRLEMLYRVPGASLAFGKSVDKTLYNTVKSTDGAMPGYDFTANDTSASDFRLVLTPRAPATGDPITVSAYTAADNSSAPATLSGEYKAEVPSGTYTLSEQVKSGENWVDAAPWYPQRGDALTCTNASLNDAGTELTVAEGVTDTTTIDCRLTNATAALAVLTYDASSTASSAPYDVTGFTYTARVPDGETYAKNVDQLAGGNTAKAALTWVAPGIEYQVKPTAIPAGYTLLGYQKYTLTDQGKLLTAETDTSNWDVVDATTPKVSTAFTTKMLSDPSNGAGATAGTVNSAAGQKVTSAANGITVLRAIVIKTEELTTLTFKATTDTTDYNPQGGKGDASDNTKYALQLSWSGGTGAIKHNSTNLSADNPLAADGTSTSKFYLRAATAYTYKEKYKGGSLTNTVNGFANLSDGYGVNNAWAPVSMSCEPAATVNHTAGTLLGGDGTVNLPAGSVTCTMVNKAAQLGVLIWDDTNSTWLDGADYSVDVNPTEAGFIAPSEGWTARGSRVPESTTQVSPGGTYSVVEGSMPLFRAVDKCQLLADADNNPMSYTTGMDLSKANWVDTDCTKVTAKAGEYRVVRAVTTSTPFLPELPLTGGTARDIFLITGLLAAAVAGVSAFVIRRRRLTQA